MIIEDYAQADGLLFIGDPHITSQKPGRRVENEYAIIDVTVDKLDGAIACAMYVQTRADPCFSMHPTDGSDTQKSNGGPEDVEAMRFA